MDQEASGGESCPHCGSRHGPGQTCPAAEPLPASLREAGADPLIGSMVGSFRVARLLGRGGMGSVYLGEHPVIGSKVAIKFLHEGLATNPELVGRFYDEARAVNLIGHENIVAIYDLALLPPSRYFIVMEYLDGETLATLTRRERIPPALALGVLGQLTEALYAAHERGVIHRDLKPENVFLVRRRDQDHFVKLMDFGIAKLGDRSHGAHTAAGMIVGTPEYMAPEQCDNRPVDARTDVYALGIMAYEVATGQLPFTGKGVAQVLLAQLRQTPRPPRELAPGIHPALEKVILKSLEKRPEDRYPDMRALGAALREVATALAGQVAVPPGPTRAVPAAPPPRVSPPPAVAVAVAVPPPPEPPAPPPRVEIEVRTGSASRRLRVAEVSKGGIFLCAETSLPPLFTRITLLLPGPGRRTVPLAGDVVRHVSPAQAAGWNMQPGFAVQLTPSPEERAALDELAARLRAPGPAPAHQTIDGAGALQLLESLERRAALGHYELLDARLDAGLPEVRERARGLRRQVEDLRAKLPPEAQATRVVALLERIEQASQVLGTASERLMHDARRGNFRGVAHCVTAGVALAVVESRRRALLGETPERREQAQRHLARYQVAHKLGNEDTALLELEQALHADPLNLELHELHVELEMKLRIRRGTA